MKATSILALVLACFLCIGLLGCGKEAVSNRFDPEKEGIVKVILSTDQGETFLYKLIGTQGRIADTEEFESAALTALFAEGSCFAPTVRDGKVCNAVISETLCDDTGSPVMPDPSDLVILEQTAALHSLPILSLTVVTCGGYRFPIVELDNNDVILYYFNTASQQMTKLYSGKGLALAGMQIANPNNLP